ncbi:MAG: NAD(P)H-dependent flavin oxidoreductase [Fusobacteriaceae bacterium]
MKIKDLEIAVPIIQGGMAIRASMSRLASAVANEGGLGVIAGTTISCEELKAEIEKARKMIVNKGGALGVNLMYAGSTFADLVRTSIDAGIDVIITGAGFSRDIYEMVKGTNVKVFPIVSSAKLAKMAEKLGADAIIVEGGNAGGHLGSERDSWDIVPEVIEAVSVPVFGAGGVITPEDGMRMLSLGAAGIQMGSRFVASLECEVSEKFKELYLKAKEGDIVRIMSSAGLPANAIKNTIVDSIMSEDTGIVPKKCHLCLKKCTRTFCVSDRLVKGHDGDVENGLVFAGVDAWKIDSIMSVKEIMKSFNKIF